MSTEPTTPPPATPMLAAFMSITGGILSMSAVAVLVLTGDWRATAIFWALAAGSYAIANIVNIFASHP